MKKNLFSIMVLCLFLSACVYKYASKEASVSTYNIKLNNDDFGVDKSKSKLYYTSYPKKL